MVWGVINRKGGDCGVVADGATQAGEGVAQIAEGVAIGPIGPEQPGQRLAAMRPVGLDGQIGQERADLVGLEVRHRAIVQADVETPEK